MLSTLRAGTRTAARRWASASSFKTEVAAPQGIDLTDECVKRILKQNAADAKHPYLRLNVVTGGCQGAKYDWDWDDTVKATDKAIKKDGATVLVDERFYETLKGAEIDFKYEMKANQFHVKRPEDDSYETCSCGASFAPKTA